MIGPFRTNKIADEAADALNATRPPIADTDILPRGRWHVYASHGFWLRWAEAGPYNEPFGRYNLDPEVIAYITRKDP
jgi:hypothetical protein